MACAPKSRELDVAKGEVAPHRRNHQGTLRAPETDVQCGSKPRTDIVDMSLMST